MKTVIGYVKNREDAEKTVNMLRQKGFNNNEISVLGRGANTNAPEGTHQYNQLSASTTGGDSVADGTTTGGVLGGLAGLALGAGALAIPGIGPIIAAGPIAGLFSGAATGGIAGGLIDWGIPETEGKTAEENIKRGDMMVSVRTDDSRVSQAAGAMRDAGVRDVTMH